MRVQKYFLEDRWELGLPRDVSLRAVRESSPPSAHCSPRPRCEERCPRSGRSNTDSAKHRSDIRAISNLEDRRLPAKAKESAWPPLGRYRRYIQSRIRRNALQRCQNRPRGIWRTSASKYGTRECN